MVNAYLPVVPRTDPSSFHHGQSEDKLFAPSGVGNSCPDGRGANPQLQCHVSIRNGNANHHHFCQPYRTVQSVLRNSLQYNFNNSRNPKFA